MKKTNVNVFCLIPVQQNRNNLIFFNLVYKSGKKDVYAHLNEFPHFLQIISRYKEVPTLIPQTVEKSDGDCKIGGKTYEFKTRETAKNVGREINEYPFETILKVLVKTGSNSDGISSETAKKSILDKEVFIYDFLEKKRFVK